MTVTIRTLTHDDDNDDDDDGHENYDDNIDDKKLNGEETDEQRW